MSRVTFCVGTVVGQEDDSVAVERLDSETDDDLLARAVAWSASLGHPESDGEYAATVWVEDEDGEVVAQETVTISAAGEQEVAS